MTASKLILPPSNFLSAKVIIPPSNYILLAFLFCQANLIKPASILLLLADILLNVADTI